ncbi:P27 family phage terminase small subunit [Ligilactobacillus salivarius]|uniref:P27 family phage terminase small subunit n=1 Tax=Ligilactobacillus salivarius TaxID=1624 RepID=UPI0025A3CF89|nr:P27 family phage terminase small subunit [Ligilactobacillus salivarius]MDM8284777.1 P27 family phage terminase small subunit [Ligilactobacillus salivarius]
MKDKKITALVKKYLMGQIDVSNPVQVEKVERYCTLANVYYSLEKKVNSKNILTEIKNGSQKYIKTNPAVSEMAKINAQMINLSKDMGLSAPPPGVKALAEAGYKESDLI